MKDLKFSYNSILTIQKIINPERAEHLSKFIGESGEMISWIKMNERVTKYKIRFQNGEQHYFFEEELAKR